MNPSSCPKSPMISFLSLVLQGHLTPQILSMEEMRAGWWVWWAACSALLGSAVPCSRYMAVAVLACCGQGEFLGMIQMMETSLVTIYEHLSH